MIIPQRGRKESDCTLPNRWFERGWEKDVDPPRKLEPAQWAEFDAAAGEAGLAPGAREKKCATDQGKARTKVGAFTNLRWFTGRALGATAAKAAGASGPRSPPPPNFRWEGRGWQTGAILTRFFKRGTTSNPSLKAAATPLPGVAPKNGRSPLRPFRWAAPVRFAIVDWTIFFLLPFTTT